MIRRLALLSVFGVGVGAVWAPRLFEDPDAARLREENRRLQVERQTLQKVVARLTGERRVAHLLVTDQTRHPDGSVARTVIKFQELGPDNEPLDVREFQVQGDVIYFDGLVIKFEESDETTDDMLRGKSLVLFRRVFGESQAPEDGLPIDPLREIPDVYQADDDPTPIERDIWLRFWDYATDPAAAAEVGVRVAQGEAVYNRFRKGQFWVLTLENDGGLNLVRREIPALITEHLSGLPVSKP